MGSRSLPLIDQNTSRYILNSLCQLQQCLGLIYLLCNILNGAYNTGYFALDNKRGFADHHMSRFVGAIQQLSRNIAESLAGQNIRIINQGRILLTNRPDFLHSMADDFVHTKANKLLINWIAAQKPALSILPEDGCPGSFSIIPCY